MTADEEEVERLMDEAFDALDEFDYSRALKLGRRLKKLRHSSAFEIIALAHAGDEKLDDAIAVLEEGVRTVPSVWILWQLLGNYYSDRGRYADSLACYRRALGCPDVDSDAVHLNTSIALGRSGDYAAALAEVAHVAGPELEPRAISHRMYLLNCAGRFADCVTVGEQWTSATWSEDYDEQRAAVHAQLASALWALKHERDLVLTHAWKAIELHRREPTAAWVIRDVSHVLSAASRHMTLRICGRWPYPFEGETEPFGFMATYDVVAETAEEAMDLIRPFEPERVRDTLTVDECTLGEPAADQPKGVYEVCGGYVFFPLKD